MNRLRKVFNKNPKTSETYNQYGSVSYSRSSSETSSSGGFRPLHRGPYPLKVTDIVQFIDISAENACKLAENSNWQPGGQASLTEDYHDSKVPFVIDKELVNQFPAPPSSDILPPNPAFADPKYAKLLGLDVQPSYFVRRQPVQRSPTNSFLRPRARVPYFHANASSPSVNRVNSDASSVRTTHSSYRTAHSNVSAQSIGSYLKQGPVAHRPVVYQASGADLHKSTHFQAGEWEAKFGTPKQDNASIRRKRRQGQINPTRGRLISSPTPMLQPPRLVDEDEYYNINHETFSTKAPRR